MELALDKELLLPLSVGVTLIIIGIFLFLVMPAAVEMTKPKLPPLPYNFTAQLEFMNYTICAQTDAYQMFMQNPKSNHPNVLKLTKEMGMYNNIAEEVRKSGLKAENFTKC